MPIGTAAAIAAGEPARRRMPIGALRGQDAA
jgi:hypothetical protein